MSFGPCFAESCSVLVYSEINELAGQQRAETGRNVNSVRFTAFHSDSKNMIDKHSSVFLPFSLPLFFSPHHHLHSTWVFFFYRRFEFESPNQQKCVVKKEKKKFLSSWPGQHVAEPLCGGRPGTYWNHLSRTLHLL